MEKKYQNLTAFAIATLFTLLPVIGVYFSQTPARVDNLIIGSVAIFELVFILVKFYQFGLSEPSYYYDRPQADPPPYRVMVLPGYDKIRSTLEEMNRELHHRNRQ